MREGNRFSSRDVDDPLAPVGGQVDLLVAGHLFQHTLDIRLLHEAELQLHADDAAAVAVAVEDGDPVAVVMDIGDLAVGDFDEDQVAGQDPVALPQQSQQRGGAVGSQAKRFGAIRMAFRSMNTSHPRCSRTSSAMVIAGLAE